MKSITLFLLGGVAFVAAAIPLTIFFKLVGRGLHLYLEFRWQRRLIGIKDIKIRYGDKVQFYLLRDILIFNGIVFLKQVDTRGISPWELRKNGLMIKKIYVTKKYLSKEFPEAKSTEGSLFYFD